MKSWQQRERALQPSPKKSATSASRTAIGCASRWRFPNTYWVGMSNLGFQTVYRLFNAQDDIVCERVFLPPKQELAELLAVEDAAGDARVADAGRRFRRDRVLGLVRVGLRQRPDAAAPGRHAALRRRAHRRAHPLVVIGGAVTFVNPEPLAPFADVIAAGEGEVLVPGAAPRVRRGDRSRRPAAAARAGARLLHPVVLRVALRAPTARSTRLRRRGRAPARRCRCARPRCKTTDALDPPATSIFTPDTEFGSRFLVEVVRGCANLCRFCWAGYNYLPVRAFPTDRILELAEAARAHASRVGLVSIALCDHPDIERILARPARDGLRASARRRCASTT